MNDHYQPVGASSSLGYFRCPPALVPQKDVCHTVNSMDSVGCTAGQSIDAGDNFRWYMWKGCVAALARAL